MDRLSDLPDLLIEKILLSMSIFQAVRTSVLSKTWQYKWTMLPKLILDYSFSHACFTAKMAPFDYVHIVNSILLQHTGPLEELYLVVPLLPDPKKYHLNQVIRTVLLTDIKKLTIYTYGTRPHTWPSSFPTSPWLTYLELVFCELKQEPLCRGFQNLNSLIISNVICDPGTISSCISNSPKLKKITLRRLNYEGDLLIINAPKLEYLYVEGKFRSISLPQAQHIREMDIDLNSMREYSAWEMAYLIDFFGSLVRLKSLRLSGHIYKIFALAGHLSMLPRGFGELRFVKLTSVNFCDVAMLRSILCFLRSSPCLRRLEIIANSANPSTQEEDLNLQVESEIRLLQHLEMVGIGPITGTKNELDVIKFLLHHSPALQDMAIWHYGGPKRISKVRFAKKLTNFHHASAGVKIDVFNFRDSIPSRAESVFTQRIGSFRA